MKALLCTPFCTTNSKRNNTESPGGGITRRYNADVFGFDGQGSRQKIAAYDELKLTGPLKDTDCASAPGALGSGDDGGRQVEASRAPAAPMVIRSRAAMKTRICSF